MNLIKWNKVNFPFQLIRISSFFLVLLIFLNQCQKSDEHLNSKKNRTLYFCKNTSSNHCLPPFLQDKVFYQIKDLNLTSTMQDYLNSMYFSGETLSFEIQFSHKLSKNLLKSWEDNFRAFYSFGNEKIQYPYDRIDFSRKSIIGFSIIGTILEKRFIQKLSQNYYPHGPVSIKSNFYFAKKKLGSRHITIYINH